MVKSSILAAAALAATSVSALNTFRHKHEKKGVSARHHPVPHQYQARSPNYLHTETETVTEWETVYVTLGDEPTAAPTEEPTTLASPTVISTPSSSPIVEAVNSPAVEVAEVEAEGATEPNVEVPTTTAPVYVAPATAASTSSAAAATSAASSSGSSSSTVKRGLAYNSADIAKTFVSTGSFSWAYNWGCTSDAQSSLGVEYVPMLWGNKNDMVSLWADCAKANIAAGATHLLSFNEPDGYTDPVNQALMSPSEAAQLHIANMNPFGGSAKIGAPAITSDVGNTASSVSWLTAFFEACNGGCTVDFCPVHWYGYVAPGADTAVSQLKEFLTTASATCNGKPLWLTEYGPLDATVATEAQIADFVTKSVEMLDSFDGLDRYSYFFVDGALSTNEVINSLGQTYASS